MAERPSFIAMTGDLVFHGASAGAWKDFDELVTPLRNARIPVYATLGNHEYWGGRIGESLFFARFPHLQRQHHFALEWGPVRTVFLDSNIDYLSATEWRDQIVWFRSTLASLDADSGVRGVLVLLHHPPFTNSTVTGDQIHVQRDIVPPFLAAKKTLAMMTGHVHSYERFARNDKVFVTSGGGGGPRATLATGAQRRHPDLFGGPALRDFNFVVLEPRRDGLDVEVRGLKKGGATLTTMDRFSLPYPP